MERYCRPVYYYETDKMGIVHNANYLRILEEARLDFMMQIGIPYTQIEAAGILIPVTEAHVQYKHTLQYGDEFCVAVSLSRFNGVRMGFDYEIRRKSDEALIATGSTGHCFIDEDSRVPLNIKKRMPEECEMMLAALAAERGHLL